VSVVVLATTLIRAGVTVSMRMIVSVIDHLGTWQSRLM
jgi:hypothetical protein